MAEIRLHDTRSGELLALEPPAVKPAIGIYACGPTVYSRIHIGNARPFVVFGTLARFLRHEGYDVRLVVNVTDVNDKIYDAARAQGVPSEQLAREMTAAYFADTDALGLGRPDHEPLASETIGPIEDYIQALIDGGHAYAVDGDVYFRVRSDPEYGSLSHRDVDSMDQGEGVEDADLKQDPLDFALWKAHKEGEDTHWPAPWGEGRPGWHIECSAMAEQGLPGGCGHPRRRLGPRVPPPRERGRPDARGARPRARPDLDAQRHDPVDRREDGQVGRQHRPAARGARGLRPGGGRHVPALRPLPPAAGLLGRGAGAGGCERQADQRGPSAPDGGRALARGARRPCASASSRRCGATSTPPRRWPR